MLRKKIIIFVLVCLIAGPLMAQKSKVTSLISKDLREFSGKEGLMITVDYAPGGQTLSIDTMHTRLFTCWKAPL
jgi:archaellum component FlaG (FlaF/FlaG flagellin family)